MKNPPLGDVPLELFLSEYWQKKPLLIRQALPGVKSPIEADELAGLACEEEVESRLVIHDEKSDKWNLTDGPFSEKVLSGLPETHWSLLVQAVDHWVPDCADFLSQFHFIPSWRVDDLMMSYSGDKGGVGPHYDNYDVFLVQVSGRRQWEVGGIHNESSALRPNTPVKILAEWEPEQRWVLESGDMLYVPPGVGHNGIAVGGDCVTCSVGFRAPSHREILLEYCEYITEQLNDDVRYTDLDLMPQCNPGEMAPAAIANVQKILAQYMGDKDQQAQWFGRHMTSPKYQDDEVVMDSYELDEVRQHVLAGGTLIRNEGSRFVFQERDEDLALFVDGRQYTCRGSLSDLAKGLCAKRRLIGLWEQSDEHDALILDLLNHGSLYLSE